MRNALAAALAAGSLIPDVGRVSKASRDKTGARVDVPRRDRQLELERATERLERCDTRKNRRRVARALRHADVRTGTV